jgi:hypothetical protein
MSVTIDVHHHIFRIFSGVRPTTVLTPLEVSHLARNVGSPQRSDTSGIGCKPEVAGARSPHLNASGATQIRCLMPSVGA